MPHCIIEYSKNLETKIAPRQLVKAVHTGAVASALFAEENIKSRVIPYTEYQTGTNDTPFIHVAAKILSGRTDEQKKHLSHCILQELVPLAESPCSITVEVLDLHRESYAKKML